MIAAPMRRLLLAPAMLALLAGTAHAEAPSAAPSLKQIVARYLAWRGGPAFERAHSLHTAGALSADGLTGTFETWQTEDHWRTQSDLGGVKQLEIITPGQSWITNTSGQIEREPDAFKYARRDPQSATALQGKGGARDALLGTEPMDGRDWTVVRVSFGDADAYDLFIDPAAGALGAMRVIEKGQRRVEHYSDWRMVQGVRVAFATKVQSEADGDETQRLSLCELNGRLDPALFHRPAPVRRASFANGAASTGWIAFANRDNDRIYLPVKVDGRLVTAIFDSGANASAVDTALAASLGHKSSGVFPTAGENGAGDAGLVQGIDLSIGDLTLHNLTIASMDLTALARKSGESWPLILGDEVFEETVVDIDFANRRIAFRDPAAFVPPPGAVTVRLAHDGDLRLVPLSLDGGAPALFVMDTGFGPALRVSPALTRAHRLLAGRPSTEVTLSAIGGDALATLASLPAVRLGGVRFASVPAMFSDTWPSATYTDREQGLLGLALLERFRVIVDWPRDRLYLIPNPGAASAPFPRDRLGISSHVDGAALVIVGIAPGSPAAAADFKPGDRILTINGRPAADAGDIGAQPAGTAITLVRQGADPTTLTLRDYY